MIYAKLSQYTNTVNLYVSKESKVLHNMPKKKKNPP